MNNERATLDWLERIIGERFGYTWRISEASRGYRRLQLEGQSGHVDIRAMVTFGGPSLAIACTRWDAVREGLVPVLGLPLPAPAAMELPAPLVKAGPGASTIGYDILGLAAWMLSRAEELHCDALDEHGRFAATESHAYRNGYLDRPVVDEWLDILRQVVERTWPGIALRRPTYSLWLSHDVDRPSRYVFGTRKDVARAVAGDVLKRRDFTSLLRAPWVRLHSTADIHEWDPYNTFEWLMDVSDRAGTVSTFNFLTGHTTHALDGNYDIESRPMRRLLRRVHERGHEIGLHPSYACYQNHALIVAQAKRLRKVCVEEGIVLRSLGGRMHYLRWETPGTLNRLQRAGLSYDSTLGYADYPGFRCGTCHEYPAFDPLCGEALTIRIRPLVAMDTTLYDEQYLGTDTRQEVILKRLLSLKETCRRVGGGFSLLWHNSQLYTRAMRETYQSVVFSASAGAPGEEVARKSLAHDAPPIAHAPGR